MLTIKLTTIIRIIIQFKPQATQTWICKEQFEGFTQEKLKIKKKSLNRNFFESVLSLYLPRR